MAKYGKKASEKVEKQCMKGRNPEEWSSRKESDQ